MKDRSWLDGVTLCKQAVELVRFTNPKRPRGGISAAIPGH